MNKEEVIKSVEIDTLKTLEQEKIKLLTNIEGKINQLTSNIKLYVNENVNDNPINSYNYNSVTNTLPYDYSILSKFCPNVSDIISEELKLRIPQPDEQKTIENKKIYLKLTKMLERLQEEIKKLNSTSSNLYKKNQLDKKACEIYEFKLEIKRLKEIKCKYDVLQS